MRECRCPCHVDASVRHIIPCCIRSSTKFDLSSIVEASVIDAIDRVGTDDEAKRQNAIQHDIESRVKASTNPGKGNERLDTEAGTDPTNTDAPRRSAPQAAAIDRSSQPGGSVPSQAPRVIDADAIIDKFNIIRSGRSLNDRDIRDSMKQFLGGLAPQQLQAIFGVLQQIGSILAPPNVDPTRLQAPPEETSAVKNARLDMLRKKHSERMPPPSTKEQMTGVATKRAPKTLVDDNDLEDDLPPIRVGSRTSETTKRSMKLSLQE